jgi:VWFA-related protein
MSYFRKSGVIVFLGLCFMGGALFSQSDKPEASPAQASGAQAGQQKTPVLKVKSRLVIVNVVARDKDGHVVTDLEANDFRLIEDGRPQKISVFAFQHPGGGAPITDSGPALPSNVFTNKPKFQPASALNIVLIDALNTTFLNQAYVRVEMVKFLEKLPPGQPIAIFAMGRKLRLLQDFTTDLTQLKKVIQTIKGEGSPVLMSPTGTAEVPMTLQGIADQIAADFAPQLRAQIQDFADQAVSDLSDLRVNYSLAALSALARMLAGYPGRKNLFWLSESVPFGIFPDAKVGLRSIKNQADDSRAQMSAESAPNIRNGAAHQREYVDQLALLSNLMADAQVSVYPIDARGLVGGAFFNVGNNVSGQGQSGGLMMKMEGQQAEELFQAHYNMRDIAEKTGGLAYYNRNDLDNAIRQGMDDGATYYTIGYYPDGKAWKGEFRKIQISVNRSGVKLRHRAGYYAVDRAEFERRHPEQRNLDLAGALNPDYPIATSVQFQAMVVPPELGQSQVRINIAVAPSQISFTLEPDGLRHGQVDCAARIFSARDIDHPVQTVATKVNAALKPDVMAKINSSYFPCQLTVELPPGHYFLRLAVRETATGLMGTANAEVTVPGIDEKSKSADNAKH